jgi:hypothetical protein
LVNIAKPDVDESAANAVPAAAAEIPIRLAVWSTSRRESDLGANIKDSWEGGTFRIGVAIRLCEMVLRLLQE